MDVVVAVFMLAIVSNRLPVFGIGGKLALLSENLQFDMTVCNSVTQDNSLSYRRQRLGH